MLLQCNPATHSEAYRYGIEPGKMEPEATEMESRNRYKTVIEFRHSDIQAFNKGVIMTVALVMIFGTALFVSMGLALIFA